MTSHWSTAPPQSFADVVETVLQEYEPVQRISVIVAAATAARERLAGMGPSTATPADVLDAVRAVLEALPPVRHRAR